MAKATHIGSSLAKKLGQTGREAFEAHKSDETRYGSGGDLPAGIEGGVAQLVDCRFSQYEKGDNKGEYFFLAAGIVMEPLEHDNVRVQGLRTQIMEPLCETPTRGRKSVEEHLEWILNELRKLGVDTESIDYEQLEEVCSQLKEEAPYFRFRTWRGTPTDQFPDSRTNHEWRGATDYTPPDANGQVTEAPAARTAAKAPSRLATASKPVGAAKGSPAADDGPSHATQDEDLAELGSLADQENEEAQARLTELAEAAGINTEEYATWGEVAELLAGGEVAEPEAAAEQAAPAKGEVYYYKPPRARKAIECEVSAVFDKAETVNLKSLDEGKVFRGVAWTDLSDQP